MNSALGTDTMVSKSEGLELGKARSDAEQSTSTMLNDQLRGPLLPA